MPDLNEIFVPEADYPAEMKDRVMPYIGARRSDGYFAGYDGNPIHYVRYASEAPKATVIISHGFTESAEKWHETAYYLLNFGYDVYIIEHRGHALSYRSVADKTLTHIDRFDEYVRDFALFVDLVRAERQTDLYLLAHSMGCAIGLLYLESRPEAFKKVFLSSPMIMPSTGVIPAWCGRFITRAAIIFGKGKKRAFVSGVYPGDENFEDSAKTSRARFDEYNAIKRSNPDYQNYSCTYGWVNNSLRVCKKILKKGEPEKIAAKVFIAIAGLDATVERKPQLALARRLRACEYKIYEGAKHEIYGSADPVAKEYFTDLLSFFEG